MPKVANAGCIVPACAYPRASHLGVCAGHWEQLTPELRTRWQQAWYDDARIAVWLAARRSALDYLASVAA